MAQKIVSRADLEHEARNFLQMLVKRDDGATLVTLSGELGAGKTSFTQAAAKGLGIEEPVTSPTFVLEKVYDVPGKKLGFARLMHIDAYRLKGAQELAALSFNDAMRDPETLIFLEWPERVDGGLPPPAAHVTLAVHDDESRIVHYDV